MSELERPTILQIASEAYVDPRTVRAEFAYQQGRRSKPVRGLSGERVRAAMARRGLVRAEETAR